MATSSPGLRTRPGKRRKPVHGGSGAASMPRTVSGACTETGADRRRRLQRSIDVTSAYDNAAASRHSTSEATAYAPAAPIEPRCTSCSVSSENAENVVKPPSIADDHEHAQVVSQVEGIRRREQRTQRTDGQAAEHVDEERAPREAVTRDAPNECRSEKPARPAQAAADGDQQVPMPRGFGQSNLPAGRAARSRRGRRIRVFGSSLRPAAERRERAAKIRRTRRPALAGDGHQHRGSPST